MGSFRRLTTGGALCFVAAASGCADIPGGRSDGGQYTRGVVRPATPASAAVSDETAPPEGSLASATDDPETNAGSGTAAPDAALSAPDELPAGLVVKELREGDGAVCEASSLVVIRYEGRVQGGGSFARTPAGERDGPWPVSSFVPGLRAGLIGMREGGRRRIVVPPQLGYGETPVTDEATGDVRIPAGSTLVFTVQLLEVRSRATGAPSDG